ncbi:Pyruvate synthase subunit PorC [subsurface metagenome]
MADINQLIEIRWHGRGGQGAVTSAELVAKAAINEGKYAQAFPSFGPERRGAPVLAFVRISSEQPIRVRAEIAQPDVVVVLERPAQDIESELGAKWRLAIIDATKIARELLGVPITNTTMVGALIKATGAVKLESLLEPLKQRFGHLAEKNINAMKRAYEETSIKE